jgi:hypothetical protein
MGTTKLCFGGIWKQFCTSISCGDEDTSFDFVLWRCMWYCLINNGSYDRADTARVGAASVANHRWPSFDIFLGIVWVVARVSMFMFVFCQAGWSERRCRDGYIRKVDCHC